MTSTVARDWMGFFLEVARQHGQDPAAWLAERGYAAADLTPARVPFLMEEHLFLDMAARIPDFGLLAMRNLVIGAFPLIDYAMMASATLGSALQRISAFSGFFNTGYRFVSRQSAEGLEVAIIRIEPGDRIITQRAIFAIAALAQLATNLPLEGPRIEPVQVSFRHREPAPAGSLRGVLRAHLRFLQPRDSISFREADLGRRNPAADPNLAKILDDAASVEVGVLPGETFEQRARAEIAVALAFGVPAAADIASDLGVSIRTLHRQLAARGTSFGDLLQAVRFDRAQAWLDSGESATTVANLVFYSEVAAFFRAYRRHFGRNPSASAPPG